MIIQNFNLLTSLETITYAFKGLVMVTKIEIKIEMDCGDRNKYKFFNISS